MYVIFECLYITHLDFVPITLLFQFHLFSISTTCQANIWILLFYTIDLCHILNFGEGNGCPLPYSGLENSIDCIVHRVTKSRTWLEWLSLKHTFSLRGFFFFFLVIDQGSDHTDHTGWNTDETFIFPTLFFFTFFFFF